MSQARPFTPYTTHANRHVVATSTDTGGSHCRWMEVHRYPPSARPWTSLCKMHLSSHIITLIGAQRVVVARPVHVSQILRQVAVSWCAGPDRPACADRRQRSADRLRRLPPPRRPGAASALQEVARLVDGGVRRRDLLPFAVGRPPMRGEGVTLTLRPSRWTVAREARFLRAHFSRLRCLAAGGSSASFCAR